MKKSGKATKTARTPKRKAASTLNKRKKTASARKTAAKSPPRTMNHDSRVNQVHNKLQAPRDAITQISRTTKETIKEGGKTMLSWAIAFLVIAIIAAFFGFGSVAGTAAWIAKVLFVIFLILFVVYLVRYLMRYTQYNGGSIFPPLRWL